MTIRRGGNVVSRGGLAWILLSILIWRSDAVEAYDCNAHIERNNIYASPSDTMPLATISFRDLCFAAGATATTEWPICQCINTGRIVSDQTNPNCPAGYLELGRCLDAKRYYEKHEAGGSDGLLPDYNAQVFRSFVPNSDLCEPCAHDVVSAVLGCQALCSRYFNNRFFMDGNAMTHPPGNQSQDNGGSWVIENPSGSNNPNHVPTLLDFHLCDVNAPGEFPDSVCSLPPQDRPASLPTTAEICRRRCGPPNYHNTPEDSVWNHDGDQWWSINYDHREPNNNLADWLRSYNNVPDNRPDAPPMECQLLLNDYCEYLLAAGFIDPLHNAQCKKGIVIRSLLAIGNGWPDPKPFVDYSGLTFDFTYLTAGNPFAGGTPGNDSICDHFRRENNLCPQTCYQYDGHGALNPMHLCQNAGILQALSGTPSCVSKAFETTRGGAVCSRPPPQGDNPDFDGKTRDVDYNAVSLLAPPRPTTCGAPRIAQVASAVHQLSYGAPYADVAATEVAKATWRNLDQTDPMYAAFGGLLFLGAPYNIWYTDVPVTLAPGLNRIVYTFTDRHLRTSGEAVEMSWTPATTTTTLPPP